VGVSGGAALPVAVLRAFEQRFGVVILEGYGLSETSPVATFNHFDTKRVPGSIGVAIRAPRSGSWTSGSCSATTSGRDRGARATTS
jgi:acyl-CoA synthetase (AMP-forming)/AMP-acid ligase II